MNKTNFFTKGLKVAIKFIATGLIIMALVVVVKNRMDLLSFGIAVIVSFFLGGLSMGLSLLKELKSMIRENNSLKRKLKKAQSEIADFNESLDNMPVNAVIDFEESKHNKTA